VGWGGCEISFVSEKGAWTGGLFKDRVKVTSCVQSYIISASENNNSASDQTTTKKQDQKDCILTALLTLCWYRRTQKGLHHRINNAVHIEYIIRE